MGKDKHERQRRRFLEERRRGIGASDMPALFGVSDWKSPMDIYADKVIEDPIDRQDENEALYWGLALEPFLARRYSKETGQEIAPGSRFRIHPMKPFFICHLDRIVLQPERGPGCLELKNISVWKEEEWENGPPLAYQVQVQHQLFVTGFQWGAIAALIGGQRFVHYQVPRNEPFIQKLEELGTNFWNNHVVPRFPPPVTQARDLDALKALYDPDALRSTILPESTKELDDQLMAIKRQVGELEKMKKKLEARLLAEMRGARLGIIPNHPYAYVYTHHDRVGYTVPPCEYNDLRRVKFHANKQQA